MKQTAVQFLIEYMTENFYLTDQSLEQFDIAKEMEKEQIINSFGVGCQVESTRLIGYHKMAEQYYNETYKK